MAIRPKLKKISLGFFFFRLLDLLVVCTLKCVSCGRDKVAEGQPAGVSTLCFHHVVLGTEFKFWGLNTRAVIH